MLIFERNPIVFDNLQWVGMSHDHHKFVLNLRPKGFFFEKIFVFSAPLTSSALLIYISDFMTITDIDLHWLNN